MDKIEGIRLLSRSVLRAARGGPLLSDRLSRTVTQRWARPQFANRGRRCCRALVGWRLGVTRVPERAQGRGCGGARAAAAVGSRGLVPEGEWRAGAGCEAKDGSPAWEGLRCSPSGVPCPLRCCLRGGAAMRWWGSSRGGRV